MLTVNRVMVFGGFFLAEICDSIITVLHYVIETANVAQCLRQ